MAEGRQFTDREKIKALAREVALRRNVYATRVRAKRMKQSIADYELAIMQAILADYTSKQPTEADNERSTDTHQTDERSADTAAGGRSARPPTKTS